MVAVAVAIVQVKTIFAKLNDNIIRIEKKMCFVSDIGLFIGYKLCVNLKKKFTNVRLIAEK